MNALEAADPVALADAEVSLLGAAMSGADIDEIAGLVDSADFYSPTHGEIWSTILRVHSKGVRPDVVSVRIELESAKVRHDPVRLFEMSQLAPVVAQAPYYATLVAEAGGLRAIQAAGIKIHQIGSRIGVGLEECREQARQAVDDATRGRSQTRARTIAEVMPAVLDIAQHGRQRVLGTAWPDLDRLIGGLGPGRLVVVGARPGVGKSLMGTNLALHFAHAHRHAVLFASLEMDKEEVGQRFLAKHARVNLTSLMEGRTSDSEWERIAPLSSEIDAMPIRILDESEQTITSIRREARSYQRERDDLALIVVDYLQLIATPGGERNRAEELGKVSRGLKVLARETGACVVAMAQVNRQAVSRGTDSKPRASDLRESGSIEADADQVILLHQPDEQVPELEVIVDKNRHGPKGVANLQVQGHYAALASVTWSPTQGMS